jgi:hypothetical protein
VIGGAAGRRGHEFVRESRGSHRVFLTAGHEHYIGRVPRLLGFLPAVIAWRRQAS